MTIQCDKTNKPEHERHRGHANQIFLKLCITLFLLSGVAIGMVLVGLCYVPYFGRFWE